MIFWLAAGIAAFLALSLWGIPIFGVHRMTLMRRATYKTCFDLMEQFQVFSKKEYDELDKEEIHISSYDHLQLYGTYIERYPRSNRIAILIHGYTAASPWSSQFASMFMKQGFNILLIDQRSHGQSQGKYTTFGYKEKYDIQAWVDWIVSRKGEDCIIALHGQSLGGGTVLEYAAIHRPQVRFIVADCPYSDLTELIRYQVSKLNFLPPWPFMSLINRRLQRKADFRMEDVSPITIMKSCKLPVLFVHGGADRFVPTRMSIDMFEIKPEPKELLIIDKATHGVAHCHDRQRYEETLCAFSELVLGPPSPMDLMTAEDLNENINGNLNESLNEAPSTSAVAEQFIPQASI